jgi:hypothetical protein
VFKWCKNSRRADSSQAQNQTKMIEYAKKNAYKKRESREKAH